MMKEGVAELAEIYGALGHPVRLAIARGLLDNACNVNKIVRALKVKQSSVSQHLKIMKNAGIIRGERQGVRICYRIISAKAIKIIKGG